MSASARRARPTLRCISEDLGIQLPSLDVDLGNLEPRWLKRPAA